MKEGAKVYVGVDIAKAHLEVAAGKQERHFGTTPKGSSSSLAGCASAGKGCK